MLLFLTGNVALCPRPSCFLALSHKLKIRAEKCTVFVTYPSEVKTEGLSPDIDNHNQLHFNLTNIVGGKF